MKKIKYLILITLALLLSATVFTACNTIPDDHTELLKSGKIYRVTYEADGGKFATANKVFLYFAEPNFKAAIPDKNNVTPIKYEQFVRRWYYKKITKATENGIAVENVEKIEWTFETDVVTFDMMTKLVDKKTGITFYDFILYPEWEYNLYIDYCVSYVETDGVTYINTLTTSTGDEEIVSSDYTKQEELPGYNGIRGIRHGSGTAVPENFDPIKHAGITSSDQIHSEYYADAALTQRLTFPLDSDIAPKAQKGKNHIKVYVKFFKGDFIVLASKSDLTNIMNANYYLWRDIDFGETVNVNGQTIKKKITASERFENKVFLGNGFTMSNMSVECRQGTASAAANMGMFGTIINSKITDLTLSNCSVYFVMSEESVSINCGLLAGSLNGADTIISNLTLSDCYGYVRNNKTSTLYNVKYNEGNDFVYNASSGVNASKIDIETDGLSYIKYFNLFVRPIDTKADSGFDVWNYDNQAGNMLLIQFGGFNQMLKKRDIVSGDGRDTGYYITIEVRLTEIDGVSLSILGEDYTGELDSFDYVDGWYVCKIYVPEEIKSGKIIVEWNDEVSDEYKYLVTGGSGDIVAADKSFTTENVSVSYDDYTNTLIYGTGQEMKHGVAGTGTGLNVRPEGYAVPLKVRIFAKVAEQDIILATESFDFMNIKIMIDGKEYDISEVGLISDIETQTHYFVFWQSITPESRNKEIIINFYGRYELRFNIVAAGNIRFQPKPVTQSVAASGTILENRINNIMKEHQVNNNILYPIAFNHLNKSKFITC